MIQEQRNKFESLKSEQGQMTIDFEFQKKQLNEKANDLGQKFQEKEAKLEEGKF